MNQNKKYSSKIRETPAESVEKIVKETENMLNLRETFHFPEIDAAGAMTSNSYEREKNLSEVSTQDGIVYGTHFIKKAPKETVGDLIDQINEIQSYINMFIEGHLPHASPIDLRFTCILTKDIPITSEIHRMNILCNELFDKFETQNNKKETDDNSQTDSDDISFDENDQVFGEEDACADEIRAINVRSMEEYGTSNKEDVQDFEELLFEFERLCMILELFWDKKQILQLDDHLDDVIDYDTLFS